MAGNPHPVFVDNVPPEKASARAYLPLRLGNADALRGLDGSTFWLAYIHSLRAFFYRDTSDTTSADNGTSVIADANGARWKIAGSAGIYISAAGPLADRGDFDAEDPGFAYYATDESLLYIRLTAGGWSDGVDLTGPAGADGATGATGAQGPQGPQGPSTITVGTVTTLGEGQSATVTNSGDPANVVLDFGIPEGATGATGATGAKGDTGDQGPIGPGWDAWQGAWVTATSYALNDAVENDGSSYICTSAHTSGSTTEPGVGVDWQTVWDLVAAKGADGAGSVDSVNGQTGTVSLDADDISDTSTMNKWANATSVASIVHAATGKTTPVDADELALIDSAASNVLKKLTWANLKATLKTYFDTLYQPFNATLTSWAGKTVPSGTVVGTSDTQTLTNKTIAYASNTLTGVAPTSRSVSTATGLTGGGDLSADRTIEFNLNALTEDTTPDSANDFVVTYDASASAHKKVKIEKIGAGGGGQPIPSSSSDWAVGVAIICTKNTSGNLSNGSTISGGDLRTGVGAPTGGSLSGTWKNISGSTIGQNDAGYFVRTA